MVLRWCRAVVDGLAAARTEIDALNVYPVPDRDTGSNLLATMSAATDALEAACVSDRDDMGPTMTKLARAALVGACGNAGGILAAHLGGAANVLADQRTIDGQALAVALAAAADAGRRAVAEPVEGTFLSVSRAAADAALACADGRTVTPAEVSCAAVDAARAALARTTDQLEPLARAGVVDAGGRGLVVILESLHAVLSASIGTGEHDPSNGLDNRPPTDAGQLRAAADRGRAASGDTDRPAPAGTGGRAPAGTADGAAPADATPVAPADVDRPPPAYEVIFLLDAHADEIPQLRTDLMALGDSLVVTGAASPGELGLWSVHVHVDDAGAAIETGLRAGRPHGIRVTYLDTGRDGAVSGSTTSVGAKSPSAGSERGVEETAEPAAVEASTVEAAAVEVSTVEPAAVEPAAIEPVTAQSAAAEPGAAEPPPATTAGRRVLAVAAGAGIAELFAAAKALVLSGGPDWTLTPSEILAAIKATGVSEVVVLPNDPDGIDVAERAARSARLDGLRVAVVPSRTQVQGLAACAVHQADQPFEDDLVTMTSAAGHTRHGAVTVATHDVLTSAGRCSAGDVLGIVEGDVVFVGDDLAEIGHQVAARLLAVGGELVTVVAGVEAGDTLASGIVARIRSLRPDVDVHAYAGGQSRYALLLGVE